MENIVVVSIYDSGFGFSIMVDGVVYTMARIVDSVWEPDTLADEVRQAYRREMDFCSWLKGRFPGKAIILCEDGGIETIQG